MMISHEYLYHIRDDLTYMYVPNEIKPDILKISDNILEKGNEPSYLFIENI